MGRKNKKKFKKFPNIKKRGEKLTKVINVKTRSSNYVPKVALREDQVGITEYITQGYSFQATFKSRYSDFHVNEIDLNGDILELTDLSVPNPEEKVMSPEELLNMRSEVKGIINDEAWNEIQNIFSTNSSDENKVYQIDTTALDKEKRTSIHRVIKQVFNGKLNSKTVNGKDVGTDENKQFIMVMKATGGHGRKQWTFPGEYVHFLVHKQNWDTTDVVTHMADFLHLKPSTINYSGTKDKRGITTQMFCIKKRYPRDIMRSIKDMSGVRVGNFTFHDKALKLGDLRGNRFRVALRDIKGDHSLIKNNLTNLEEKGFINYFGMQRFGNNASVPTYEIGVALLKEDYKLACELILKPRDGESSHVKAMRDHWWQNRNSYEAGMMLGNNNFIEKKLLEGLYVYGENDYATALRKLPRNMLLLYLHAFQSLIFNKIVSRRIKEFGLKLLPGDLVYCDRNENDSNVEDIINEMDDANVTETESSGMESDGTEKVQRKVLQLSESEAESDVYSIYDVVLPLPGFDVVYPANIISTWYDEFLKDYGLDVHSFTHKIKTYALPGTYRKIILKPNAFKWNFVHYTSPTETLISSDWDQVNNYEMNRPSEEITIDNCEKLSGLILEFCLPSAAYATAFLRELIKSDIRNANKSMTLDGDIVKETDNNIEKTDGKNLENSESKVEDMNVVESILENSKEKTQLSNIEEVTENVVNDMEAQDENNHIIN